LIIRYRQGSLIIVLIMCCAGQISFCADPGKKTQFLNSNYLIPGEYLRSDYLKSLEQTRSPIKSVVRGTPQLVKIDTSQKGILFRTIISFHEGGPEFLMEKGGIVKTLVDAGYKIKNVKIKIVDSQNVKICFDTTERLEDYLFVGNVEKYVAAKCLVGNYVDKNGQKYIFQKDGWAQMTGKRIKYSIGLDYPPSFTNNYFTSDSNEYVFDWSGEILKIFNVKGGSLFEDGIVEESPFLNLKKE
jgi:hypothetical protein